MSVYGFPQMIEHVYNVSTVRTVVSNTMNTEYVFLLFSDRN